MLEEVRLVHCTRTDNFVGVQRQIPNSGAPRMRLRTSEVSVGLDSMEHMQRRLDCEPPTQPNSESQAEIDSQMGTEFQEEPNEEANVFAARLAIGRPSFRAVLATLD